MLSGVGVERLCCQAQTIIFQKIKQSFLLLFVGFYSQCMLFRNV